MSDQSDGGIDRTTIYVATIPGMKRWGDADDYETLAEWAGGGENVELWDLTSDTACNGCGREVTLMGNGYCGLCQSDAPEVTRRAE